MVNWAPGDKLPIHPMCGNSFHFEIVSSNGMDGEWGSGGNALHIRPLISAQHALGANDENAQVWTDYN